MGQPATYLLICAGGRHGAREKWGALDLPSDVFRGPDGLMTYLLSLEAWELTDLRTTGNGGLTVDDDQQRLWLECESWPVFALDSTRSRRAQVHQELSECTLFACACLLHFPGTLWPGWRLDWCSRPEPWSQHQQAFLDLSFNCSSVMFVGSPSTRESAHRWEM